MKLAGHSIFESLTAATSDPLEQFMILLFAVDALEAALQIKFRGAVAISRNAPPTGFAS